MNKKLNVLKVGLALVVGVMVTGCASVGSVNNKMVDNTSEGILYGVSGVADDLTVKTVCDAIKNRDYRCSNPEKYVVATVWTKFGFADGVVGINALVNKDFKHINKLRHKYSATDKNVPFVKAKVTPGQLGAILEIASVDGDGKCYWSGMPRAGGVVCPVYNYDYRKDFTGVVFR